MILIGLCGGSGSGKSTVAALLSEYGVLHINTDALYRTITSYKSECVLEIATEFGDSILNDDESVNRRALGKIVFSDKNKQIKLNQITHKHVLKEVSRIIESNSERFAICVDAPLLFESGFDEECDILLAVTSPLDMRIKRIIERDGISEIDAKKRISMQLSDAELVDRVDYVIENNSGLDALAEKTFAFIKFIKNNFK